MWCRVIFTHYRLSESLFLLFIPLAEWLKAGLFRDLFREVLLDDRCLFDRGTVLDLLKGQDQGRSNSERLFALVLFELWRQDYGITI